MAIGLLVLRVVLGLLMAAHGSQKLFGWFGGYGVKGTAGFFGAGLGFRAPKLMAFMAGSSEFFGGLLIALGLVTGVGAFLIVSTMVVAILTVHISKGWQVANGGYEYNLVISTAAVALAGIGAGRYSLDHAFGTSASSLGGTDWRGWQWVVGVAVAGVLAGVLTILTFRRTPPAEIAKDVADAEGV